MKLTSISDTLISMGLALGPVARLWTRSIYHQINSHHSWDREMIFTSESRHELDFWNVCFYEYNGQPIWPIAPKCTITSYSDASAQGWGGYIVQIGGRISRGNFSENEAGKSSTWHELKGTLNVLSSSVEIIHGQILKHHTDNKNVVTVLSIGSRKPDLQELVVNIFKFCIRHNIQLVPKWVPGEENEIADEISKMVGHDDYMLSPDIFAALDILWGPHTVDRFNSFNTRQIPRLCSQWRNPGAETIDTFSVS